MTGEAIDYEDVLRRWKCNRIQAANDLERLLLRDELPSPGSVARAIVTLKESEEWVAVEDHLPEEKGEYLVTYHPCHWDDVNHGRLEVGVDTFRGNGKAAKENPHKAWAKNKYQRVTHWMPKPKPAKEEDK